MITPAQMEVLELLAEGYTTKTAAEEMGISHRTVESHISNLMARMDANTRTEAVALAYQWGWLEIEA